MPEEEYLRPESGIRAAAHEEEIEEQAEEAAEFCDSIVFISPQGCGTTPYSNRLTVTAENGSEKTAAVTALGLP